MDKDIKQAKQRRIRVISGRIENNGTASISAGAGFSISRAGVGDVSVTLEKAGRSILSASICPINSTAATAHLGKVLSVTSASSVQFGTYVADGTDGAPADIDFFFEIKVKDVT